MHNDGVCCEKFGYFCCEPRSVGQWTTCWQSPTRVRRSRCFAGPSLRPRVRSFHDITKESIGLVEVVRGRMTPFEDHRHLDGGLEVQLHSARLRDWTRCWPAIRASVCCGPSCFRDRGRPAVGLASVVAKLVTPAEGPLFVMYQEAEGQGVRCVPRWIDSGE